MGRQTPLQFPLQQFEAVAQVAPEGLQQTPPLQFPLQQCEATRHLAPKALQQTCKALGARCLVASHCCSGNCNRGVCCNPSGATCATASNCCSGNCNGGVCKGVCLPILQEDKILYNNLKLTYISLLYQYNWNWNWNHDDDDYDDDFDR